MPATCTNRGNERNKGSFWIKLSALTEISENVIKHYQWKSKKLLTSIKWRLKIKMRSFDKKKRKRQFKKTIDYVFKRLILCLSNNWIMIINNSTDLCKRSISKYYRTFRYFIPTLMNTFLSIRTWYWLRISKHDIEPIKCFIFQGQFSYFHFTYRVTRGVQTKGFAKYFML